MRQRKQGTASNPITLYLVASTDHTTPATGKTPTATISKNGGAFGAASGVVTELGAGFYVLAGHAADRDTLGELAIRVTADGCDDFAAVYDIVPFDPYADPTTTRFTNLDAAVSSRSTYAGGDTAGTTTLLTRLTNTRATNLDNLDAAISSRSTYAGADTAGTTTLLTRLTNTRATNLDNLDAAISSRSTITVDAVWAGASRTLTGFGFPVTVATNNDKTGYVLVQAFPANFAALAVTPGGAVTAGTVADKTGYVLDTAPPTAAAIRAEIDNNSTKLGQLATNYTAGRAARIDELATEVNASNNAVAVLAAVGAPLQAADYAAPPSAAAIRAEIDANSTKLDVPVSSRSTYTGADTAGTTTLLARLTNTRATNLDNLDAAVSSRLAAIDYAVGPTSAQVAAQVAATLAAAHGAGPWDTGVGAGVATESAATSNKNVLLAAIQVVQALVTTQPLDTGNTQTPYNLDIPPSGDNLW